MAIASVETLTPPAKLLYVELVGALADGCLDVSTLATFTFLSFKFFNLVETMDTADLAESGGHVFLFSQKTLFKLIYWLYATVNFSLYFWTLKNDIMRTISQPPDSN